MKEEKYETVIWGGYSFMSSKTPRRYEISLDRAKFDELWAKLREWTGSQEEFYFKFVNKVRLSVIVKKNGSKE